MTDGEPTVPLVLTHTQTIPRDDICPDLLLEEFEMAVEALERESEARGVAMDWETFRWALTVPTLAYSPDGKPASRAYVVASVGALLDS